MTDLRKMIAVGIVLLLSKATPLRGGETDDARQVGAATAVVEHLIADLDETTPLFLSVRLRRKGGIWRELQQPVLERLERHMRPLKSIDCAVVPEMDWAASGPGEPVRDRHTRRPGAAVTIALHPRSENAYSVFVCLQHSTTSVGYLTSQVTRDGDRWHVCEFGAWWPF